MDSTKMKIARRDIKTDVMAFSNASKLFYPWEPWKKTDTEFTKDPTFYCISEEKKNYQYFLWKKVLVKEENDSDILMQEVDYWPNI